MKFLFAEDNKNDLELFLYELAKTDLAFEPVWVQSASAFCEGLRVCALVFLDCNMPSLGCVEAITYWERNGKTQPLIVVSGTINTIEGLILQDLGATDFLLKKDLPRLGRVVTRALDEFKLKQRRTK